MIPVNFAFARLKSKAILHSQEIQEKELLDAFVRNSDGSLVGLGRNQIKPFLCPLPFASLPSIIAPLF
jgi:hypothetical protein